MNFADISSIMTVVAKGIGYVKTAISVGKDANGILDAVKDLAVAAQSGPVTVDQLEATEKSLDQEMSDFNQPIVD